MSTGITAPFNAPTLGPPPWFVHVAWRVHRALYRLSLDPPC